MGFGDFLKKAADKGAALAQDAKKAATDLAANLTKKYGTVSSGRHEGCEIALGNPPGSGIVSNSLTQIIFLDGTEEKGRYNIEDLAMVRQTGYEKGGEHRNIIKIEYSEGDESEVLVKLEVGSPFFSQVVWHKKFKAILNEEKEAAEKEKKEQEAAEEAERKEKERAERIAKALEPSCEKGDCLWNNGKFYYICDECIECNRKSSTKKMQGKVKYPQLWKYMKRFEENEKFLNDKLTELNYFKKEYYNQYGITIEEGDQNGGYLHNSDDPDRRSKYFAYNSLKSMQNKVFEEMDHFAEELTAEFMPRFSENQYILYHINTIGITNEFFDLLWDLKDTGVELTDDMILFLSENTMELSTGDKLPLGIEREIFRNPSLYNRSYGDFVYTVKAFALTPEDDPIYEKLFDPEGNVLPAGRGGPKKGFYDPCIWNVIEESLED